jgi:hypothetical protein
LVAAGIDFERQMVIRPQDAVKNFAVIEAGGGADAAAVDPTCL